MGGLTRREMLKRSAVAGGVVWAAPLLTTSGKAWGQTSGCCACLGGGIIYAKFAPGNAQTCTNQCLIPTSDIKIAQTDCLIDNGFLSVCDDVDSSDSTASLAFGNGTTPIKFGLKSTNDCYVARCNEGFGVVYRWSTSFNQEAYTATPCTDPNPPNGCIFLDPAADDDTAMFQAYTGGGGANGPCTGNVPGNIRPTGTRCGTSRYVGGQPAGCACATPITGMYFNSNAIGTTLNYIEMELCVTNISQFPCPLEDCL